MDNDNEKVKDFTYPQSRHIFCSNLRAGTGSLRDYDYWTIRIKCAKTKSEVIDYLMRGRPIFRRDKFNGCLQKFNYYRMTFENVEGGIL
jgi:hypothetical protein